MRLQSRSFSILTVSGTDQRERSDTLALEEPLEIRIQTATSASVAVAITMRTPGNDEQLAAGFLWSEGVVTKLEQIRAVQLSGPIQPGGFRNSVLVTLHGNALPDLHLSERHFYQTSSCGICGKASLEAIEMSRAFELLPGTPQWEPAIIHSLSGKLRAAQETFDATGGLHAAGLFDSIGNIQAIYEDVGRHNAVDKVVGAAVLAGTLPLSQSLLLVSGRASFELVQKTVMAGIPALAAVGAPSSLAVKLARETGLTLLGFVRGERFNIYAGEERIGKS